MIMFGRSLIDNSQYQIVNRYLQRAEIDHKETIIGVTGHGECQNHRANSIGIHRAYQLLLPPIAPTNNLTPNTRTWLPTTIQLDVIKHLY